MDTSKDNQNNKQENQGQIAGIAVFDSHAHFAFIHRRLRRLSRRFIWLVIFIKDNDPSNGLFAEKALELLD